METKTISGQIINITIEGYMTDIEQWNNEIAIGIAKEEEIQELTDKHFEVLEFIRKVYLNGDSLTIRKVGKSGIIDIKGFYGLFPGAPLKKASKIAGIPKPSSCV